MRALLVLATVACLAGTGCRGGSYTPIVRYALDPELRVDSFPETEASIGIRPLEAPPAYGQRMALLGAGQRITLADDAQWAQLPAGAVRRALIDALAETGAPRDVGRARDVPRPEWVMTGELRAFVVDTTTSPWVARVDVRLAARRPGEATLLWRGGATAEAPLQRDAVTAAAPAMDAAVGEVASEVADAVARALQSAGKAPAEGRTPQQGEQE
jgi:ABC-type uncharacterized transport system auxiliary subunit